MSSVVIRPVPSKIRSPNANCLIAIRLRSCVAFRVLFPIVDNDLQIIAKCIVFTHITQPWRCKSRMQSYAFFFDCRYGALKFLFPPFKNSLFNLNLTIVLTFHFNIFKSLLFKYLQKEALEKPPVVAIF